MENELIALFGGGVVGQWLTKVVGGTLEDLGDDLQQWVRRKRAKNLQTVILEAASLTDGKDVREVPGRVLNPLLEAAANEDAPEMRRRWSALLAHAATSEDDVPPALAQILRELSPLDARVLELLSESCRDRRGYARLQFDVLVNTLDEHFDVVRLSLQNLVRLGLITQPYEGDPRLLAGEDDEVQRVSYLGEVFLSAVTGKPIAQYRDWAAVVRDSQV